MIVLIWLCIGLAMLLWPFVAALNFDLTSSDAAGNGIAQAFALLGTIGIWSLLSIAALLAGLRGLIPLWSLLVALVLIPLSGFAAGNVITVLAARVEAQWLAIVVIAVPPLLALYLGWAAIPAFHGVIAPRTAAIVIWASVAVIAALPWPQVIALPALQQKRIDDWYAHRDALTARFNALAANGSLEDWWHFLPSAEDQREAVVQQIRNFTDRQQRIETLLNAGDGSGFPSLYDLDIAPSAELCAGARHFLQGRIPGFKPASDKARYKDIRDIVEPYGNTLRWLVQNRCPLQPELDQLEAVIRSYPDAEEAILLLTDLDEMRRDLGK